MTSERTTNDILDLADRVKTRVGFHGPVPGWVHEEIDKAFAEARECLVRGGSVSITGIATLLSKEFPERKVAGNLPHLKGRTYTIPERRRLIVEPEWSMDRDLREGE